MAKRKARRRANGEGTIYQRRDGRWCGQATVGESRVTVYADTQAGCRERLAEAVALRSSPVAACLTVREGYTAWLGSLEVEEYTRRRYERQAAPILAALGDSAVESLQPADVLRFYGSLAEAGHSSHARNGAGKRLRQLWKFLRASGLTENDPVSAVQAPRHRSAEMRPMTRGQVSAFLAAAAGDRYEGLYRLALDAGARQGEMFALTPADLDGREVSFNKSLHQNEGKVYLKRTKTPKGRRRVTVTRRTADLLHALAAGTPAGDPLWAGGAGGRWVHASAFRDHHYQPMLRRAGLPGFRFHDLRHTCATLLLLANVHPKVVSERLGHSGIEVTLNLYSHLLPGMQRPAVEALEELLQ